MAVAHFALDLRARNERRHGVHNDNIDGVGAHERLGDLERLFAGIRLRNEQRIHVYAERGRIDRVKCVLHVDKRRVAAHFLAFGDAVERQGGLTGGFRPVDLNDSAARQTADTEREVQRKRAGGDRIHVHAVVLAKAHDSALAELLFNLRQRSLKRFTLVFGLDVLHFFAYGAFIFLRHGYILTSFEIWVMVPDGLCFRRAWLKFSPTLFKRLRFPKVKLFFTASIILNSSKKSNGFLEHIFFPC